MTLKPIVKYLLIAATMCVSSFAVAGDYLQVTVTNLTRGQIFTPILVVSHSRNKQLLFRLGKPASEELAALAEGGAVAPLADALRNKHGVKGIADSGMQLTEPGHTTTVKVPAHGAKRISLAAMLLPTNDAFVSLNNVRAPLHGSITYTAVAYDAGSETNDELCVSIPGPPSLCNGEPLSPNDDGEGYVHVHAGIHSIGDLDPAERDWRNPVAQVTIKRVYH
jgi:hypothetical protein